MDTRTDVVEYGLRRWIIVLGVMFAPLMETIDSSIVNVALPTIQGNLGATLDEAAWVITGYLVANVIVIPLTPWLQTRFGRRQYFTATVIGFTLASALCGMSGSIEMLIVLRIVQGLFGGGLIATAQATLRDTFTVAEVGLSQGIFAVIILVGPDHRADAGRLSRRCRFVAVDLLHQHRAGRDLGDHRRHDAAQSHRTRSCDRRHGRHRAAHGRSRWLAVHARRGRTPGLVR